MLCKNPYMKGVMPLPCRDCNLCRSSRKREWSGRIVLEAGSHPFNTFVTLSYRDEELEHAHADWNGKEPLLATLVPKHLQEWLKRLRRGYGGKIRYFAVGEYGGRTGRPHYHIALFGFPNCVYGQTNLKQKICCGPCERIKMSWVHGSVYLGELNEKSASYVAGYVQKKMTGDEIWTKEKLKGREPQFTRMSLKPGIGAIAIKNLINFSELTRSEKYVKKYLDAPVVLRKNGSMLKLGRYLRGKWREGCGRGKDTPQSVLSQQLRELQARYEEDKKNSSISGVPRIFQTPKDFYYSENFQKIKNFDAKEKIYYKEKII